MNGNIPFYIICGLAVLTMLIFYRSRKRRILSVLFGTLSGLAVLAVMNRYGGYIGAELPMNAFNICGSGILGVPFVAVLIILKYI